MDNKKALLLTYLTLGSLYSLGDISKDMNKRKTFNYMSGKNKKRGKMKKKKRRD